MNITKLLKFLVEERIKEDDEANPIGSISNVTNKLTMKLEESKVSNKSVRPNEIDKTKEISSEEFDE